MKDTKKELQKALDTLEYLQRIGNTEVGVVDGPVEPWLADELCKRGYTIIEIPGGFGKIKFPSVKETRDDVSLYLHPVRPGIRG